jgi:hypothetical protein
MNGGQRAQQREYRRRLTRRELIYLWGGMESLLTFRFGESPFKTEETARKAYFENRTEVLRSFFAYINAARKEGLPEGKSMPEAFWKFEARRYGPRLKVRNRELEVDPNCPYLQDEPVEAYLERHQLLGEMEALGF